MARKLYNHEQEVSAPSKPTRVRDAASVREYTKTRYLRLRDELVSLLGGKCVRCAVSDENSRLDFDHKNPKSKSFDIGPWILRNFQEAKHEALTKCQLLCRKCHCAKTHNSKAAREARKLHVGEKHHSSKLTDAQRAYAEQQVAAGRSHRSLADELGVRRQSISAMLSSGKWRTRT